MAAKKPPTQLTAEEMAELVAAGQDAGPEGVEVQKVEFAELGEGESLAGPAAGSMQILWDVPMTVEVVLGTAAMPVRDVLRLGPGAVVELDRAYGEPVEIYLNSRLVARGEVVVVGEQFGVRVTEILVSAEEVSPELTAIP